MVQKQTQEKNFGAKFKQQIYTDAFLWVKGEWRIMRVKCEEAQKSEEEQVCQKIVTLENALSKGDSELCHKLFVENPSALTTLQRHMLFQEFPAEYLDLARKVFHDLSGNTISNQGEVRFDP